MFAFIFESVGSGEWLLLLAVILIVVGPRNLPSAARKCGKILAQLRRAADEFKRQIMTMDEEMKKAVDEVKKDYIDIPEDTPATTATPDGPTGPDGTTDGGSHDMDGGGGGPGADYYEENPDGYYDETKYDYAESYGYDGGDDSGPVLGQPDGAQPAAESAPANEEAKTDANAATSQ